MTNTEYLRISSNDGRNTVESFINQVKKKADKGQVEFGVDINVERIDESDMQKIIEETQSNE